jgi:hypothetical protein
MDLSRFAVDTAFCTTFAALAEYYSRGERRSACTRRAELGKELLAFRSRS